MENNAKTREPLDDDALDAVAGGEFKGGDKPAYWVKPAWVYTGYARHPVEAPDYVAPQGDSGGWRCKQCGGTYSGLVTMKPDKCTYCGGEWIRVL